MEVATRRLSRLTGLDLYSNRLGDEGVQILSDSTHLSKLTSLDLSDNHISAAGIQALTASPLRTRLRTLFLAANRFGDVGARELLCWPALTGLTLTWGIAKSKMRASPPWRLRAICQTSRC
jgi:hypothetical protein